MSTGRQVSQATFDAIVREAISDFGHSPDEAIKEAEDQLKIMGITDFSNLQRSLDENRDKNHPAITLSNQLCETEDLTKGCAIAEELLQHVKKDTKFSSIAGDNGAVSAASRLLHSSFESEKKADTNTKKFTQQLTIICNLIAALCENQEVNRARFLNPEEIKEENGIHMLRDLLQRFVDNEKGLTDLEDWETVAAILSAIAAVQHQSEIVKQSVVADGTLDVFIRLLDVSGMGISNGNLGSEHMTKTFQKTCYIIRQLLSTDDTSVNVSETFNRARALNGGSSVMSSGLRSMKYKKNAVQILSMVTKRLLGEQLIKNGKPTLLNDCIKTIKMCMISDEVCKNVLNLHFHNLTVQVLEEFKDYPIIVHACVAMLRNLSSHDQAKTFLFDNIELIIQVITANAGTSNANKLFDHYAGLLSGICMKRSDIADKLVKVNAFQLLFEGMATYKQDVSLQKISCIAIRNACSRDGSARQAIRDGKRAEELVRSARKIFPQQCEDVAYNALYKIDVLKDHELRKMQGYTLPADMRNTLR